MADDGKPGVYHRVHFFEGQGRRFTVRIRSDRHPHTETHEKGSEHAKATIDWHRVFERYSIFHWLDR